MNFWARRPALTNLIGVMLVLLVWAILMMTINWILPSSIPPLWIQRGLYITLLLAIVTVTRLYDELPLSWAGIGMHKWMGREFSLGILLGVFMSLVAWAVTVPFATVGWGQPSSFGSYLYWTTLITIGAAGEELLFRGYLFQRIIEILGPGAATLSGSVFFVYAHLGNPEISAIAIINIFLAGIFFSLGYIHTGSLWLPIGAHAAWNLTLAKVLGAPVSGLEFGGSIVVTTTGGTPAWTGGAFGPEGGIAATLGLILGGIALLRSPSITYSPYLNARIFWSVYQQKREEKA